MSVLSANTLFHFTPKRFILDKFENGFRPRYLSEFEPHIDPGYFDSFGGKMMTRTKEGEMIDETPDIKLKVYTPMVCFCDIPLSALKFHMSVYSNFGIGLKKEWGIKNAVNPVMYTSPNSHVFHTLKNTATALEVFSMMQRDNIKILHSNTDDLELKRNLNTIHGLSNSISSIFHTVKSTILSYLKPYESEGEYRGHQKYRYYDEKEWRYVPYITPNPNDPQIIQHTNIPDEEIEVLNSKLHSHAIEFNAQDVKYIIVEKKEDIEYIVGGLHDLKLRMNKFDDADINYLTAKIITKEEILADY